MSYSVTEDSLKDFLMENKVRAIKVMIMRNEKGQSKGSALIEFSSSQDADFVVQNL
jgi:RNA recognition motif-containing protein